VDRPLAPRIDAVRARAESLAAELAAPAEASTTVGVERATLRLLGVQGLDRAGVPLASSVVERAIGEDPARLARGILLPFVAAVVVYEASPADLALDVADGVIDLDLEAEALADPPRRATIEAAAADLIRAALERVNANRTARSELVDLLGDADVPLVGVALRAALVDEARDEAAVLAAGGADVLHVEVPASRELAERLGERAIEEAFPAGAMTRRGRSADDVIAPTGSQRGLAEIRAVVDEAAAERRAYVRLAASPLPLGGPELAVVTAFERLDIVDADPMDEIIAGGIDPSRAIADHAFVRRLAVMAGGTIRVTDGPLVVGPDLARGVPAPPEVRAGRALALQALSVALGRRWGLGDADMLLGSLPGWLLDERDATSLSVAYLMVQHGLHPGLALAVREPIAAGVARSRWSALRTLVPLVGARVGLMERDADTDGVAAAADDARTAGETGAALADTLGPLVIPTRTLDLAGRIADAADATLRELEARGWDTLVGPVDVAGAWPGRIAAGTCARRADAPAILSMRASRGRV